MNDMIIEIGKAYLRKMGSKQFKGHRLVISGTAEYHLFRGRIEKDKNAPRCLIIRSGNGKILPPVPITRAEAKRLCKKISKGKRNATQAHEVDNINVGGATKVA